jgi:hypothetical protein
MKIRLLLSLAAFVLIFTCCKKKSPDTPASALNPYDGRYRMEGTLADAKEPTYSWPGDTYEYNLETVSATQIKLISKDLGFAGHLIRIGINLSYYGNFGMLVTFDPATNKITGITNPYGQPSVNNGRSAILDPSGINTWDPVTKNIKIKYWMDETGIAGHRTAFNETWVYIGPR